MDEQKNISYSSLLRQFEEMKEKHPDAILLFRSKDSYKAYKQDATKTSLILGIDTKTRNINGEEVKVTSFPHYSLDTYLPKIVRAGNRVAICEQLELKQKPELQQKGSQGTDETETKYSKSQEDNSLKNKEKMPRKKKEEEPKQDITTKVSNSSEKKEEKKETAEAKKDQKNEVNQEQKNESKQERKPREPQMITVNGDKVTHGHAYQNKQKPEDWYFTAKINGEQLKPQKMDAQDLEAYRKKEMTVPQLMEKYYPSKIQQKVPDVAFQVKNVISGPEGNLTVDKFNVYKETDEQRPDFGKYKFYAEIGVQKMSVVAERKDLNAYFDKTMTPGQLVEKNFGEKLHLKSAYEGYKLPEGVDPKGVRIAKDRSDDKWKVSFDLGEKGRTSKQPINYDDGYSLFQTKTATREQIAAKYLNNEIKNILSNPMKMEQTASMKVG